LACAFNRYSFIVCWLFATGVAATKEARMLGKTVGLCKC
jgi:hypothetical protein